MREDEDQFGRFVPLLRRIIILAAVLTAVPVILWTITTFVRNYVGPPRLPTFHQLTATASINAPANTDAVASGGDQAPAAAAPTTATIEARATVTDARDAAPTTKGPLLGDHPPNADSNTTASMPKMAEILPATSAAESKAGEPPASTPTLANSEAANNVLAAQQPAAVGEPQADSLPAAAPLSEPIPLPRRRPRVFALAGGAVPLPRPRPDIGEPSASAETPPAASPDWFQNLFH